MLYVAAYAKPLTAPTGFNKIYNDHGSALPQDYAGFLTSPEGVGSYSASDDDASQPDAPGLAVLRDPEYYNLVELGYAAWDDSGSGADEDGTVYSHPQFGDFGTYLIVRSHSRPDPDTTSGLDPGSHRRPPKYVPTTERERRSAPTNIGAERRASLGALKPTRSSEHLRAAGSSMDIEISLWCARGDLNPHALADTGT